MARAGLSVDEAVDRFLGYLTAERALSANTLYQLKVSIHLAKITTNLDQVLDVFYVSDTEGRKIRDARALDRIRERILEALQPAEEEEAEAAAAAG